MSAILGVFGGETPLADAQVGSMLRAMSWRGDERTQVWRGDGATLAVSRSEWELDAAFAGRALIAADDRLVVAADASIYYRTELVRSLTAAGIPISGDSPAELILGAFRAWGEDCLARLEADFAFVVWDRVRRRAVAARDFGGKRPLHYAQLGRELVVASTIGGVIAHPRCPTDLNLPIVGATTAGLLMSAGPETAYESVRVLPNACQLAWSGGRTSEPFRYWEPSFGGPAGELSHQEAAEQLRELLVVATRERMDPNAATSVWMSGGWDSTSVFATAQEVARRDGSAHRPVPVSISYPEGDPGREDELIEAVADRWDSPIHWIDIGDIPFFDREPQRAAERDEPYAHLYQKWNTALAAGSRACGSRVALDGNGGDQLFQSSDIVFADLLRRGKLLRLAHEWPARKRGGYRDFFRSAVQPNLPPALLRLAGRLRGGRPLRHYLERGVPEWLEPGFLRTHRLEERDRGFLTRAIDVSHGEREIDWQLTCLFISRAFSLITGYALSQGVELRSPLSDRRVIEFALSRPWWERSSGRETKVLLRRAMAGLLPPSVLEPRAHRTGITAGYSHRWMAEEFPRLLHHVLEKPMILEELGIVDVEALRTAASRYPRVGDSATRVRLFYTLQTELWLRARESASRAAAPNDPTLSASGALS